MKVSPTDNSRVVEDHPGLFQGVAQIFLYNWHFYAAALAIDSLIMLLMTHFFLRLWIHIALFLLAAVATFWALASLFVSHYIYDRSQLYRWNWLMPLLTPSPKIWANIHAGLDQSSDSLLRLFPGGQPRILDIYAPSEMSEVSIQRARHHAQPAPENQPANPAALPLDDCECDTIFLIFVAHELRRPEARLRFFRELSRSLKPGGRVVLVEHLRDWKNFLAYGPGTFHFFSEREWLTVSSKAGFRVANQIGITPFVSCFVFAKHNRSEPPPRSQSVFPTLPTDLGNR